MASSDAIFQDFAWDPLERQPLFVHTPYTGRRKKGYSVNQFALANCRIRMAGPEDTLKEQAVCDRDTAFQETEMGKGTPINEFDEKIGRLTQSRAYLAFL